MGKPTGFLEYERKTSETIPPKERIKNFQEFHIPLSEAEQRKQGARCMECGVPFCQAGMMIKGMTSGCPLHNLFRSGMTWCITATGDRLIKPLKKDQLFPGIYFQSLSGSL